MITQSHEGTESKWFGRIIPGREEKDIYSRSPDKKRRGQGAAEIAKKKRIMTENEIGKL
jgi:hypothetical protein